MKGQFTSVEMNALYAAVEGCGIDYAAERKLTGDVNAHYAWLENTTITSLVVELTDKLHELGYSITKDAKPSKRGARV